MEQRIFVMKKISATNTILWLIAGVFSLALIIIIFGIFHGFDWTDEAWLFSTVTSGRDALEAPWGYQQLLSPLAAVTGQKVLSMRIVRLIFTILLGLFIAKILLKTAASRNVMLTTQKQLFVYFMSQLGTLLLWSWPARNFGYNEIASIIVQGIVIWLVYLLLAKRSLNSTKVLLQTSALGLFIGILWYAKFTSVILLLPISLLVVIWTSATKKVSNSIALLTGLTLGVLSPVTFGGNIGPYLSKILETLLNEEVRSANAHSGNLIQMYLIDIYNNFVLVFPFALLLLIAFALSFKLLKENIWASGASTLISIALFGWLALQGYKSLNSVVSGAEKTGKLAIYLGITALVLIVLFGFTKLREIKDIKTFTLSPQFITAFILLAIEPLLVSAGTNNAPSVHLAYGSTTWAALAGFVLALAVSIYELHSPKLVLVPLAIGLIYSLFALMLVFNDSQNPYRSFAFQKNTDLIVGDTSLDGILVTTEEAKWANWLTSQSKELGASTIPTISLKSPGALLLFNNSPYANPWLDEFWPASYWSVANNCKLDKTKDLIVLEPGTVTEQTQDLKLLNKSLEQCGLSFSNDFKLVSSYQSPNPIFDMKIWRLKSE